MVMHKIQALILFLIIPFLCFSQSSAKTGVIMGVVKDKNTQETLIGATVIIDGSLIGAISNLDGRYRLTDVPIGTHNLKAQILGYKPEIYFNVVVTTGNTQIINFELEETKRELSEIVVALDKNKSAISTDMVTPLSIQKLTTEEIKVNPGGNFDVSKVIQVLPGVGGGMSVNRNDIIVRGGAPNENVYYLDGMEIPVLNHFQTQGASGGATGILNVSFIDDLQLSSSAFDARYDNVLSSVFNIKQREGNTERLSGNLRLSGTEFATTFEGPIGSKTNFLASARRSYLQYLFQALDLPIRPEYWDFQYKITHKVNEKTSLNFISVGAIDKFTLAVPKKATLENEYILRSNPLLDQWNYTFGVSMKRLINKGFYTLSFTRNLYDNAAFREEKELDESNITLDLNSQEIENKIRFDVNKFVLGWKYSYGAMAQYVKYNSDIYSLITNEIKDENDNVIVPQTIVDANSSIDFFKYGFFTQLSKRFFYEKLLLSAGLRTDGNSFTKNGNQIQNTLSPRLSFSYDITSNLDITGSFGNYYKIPTYTNLGFRNNQGELVNQDIEYIQSTHYVLGFQYLPRTHRRYTLEGFYKKYNYYPVSERTGISLANQGMEFTSVGNEDVASIGEGRTYGVEFLMQQKLIKKLFYLFSATIFKSEFSGKDGEFLPSSWDFSYLVSTTLGYKFNKGYDLGLKYRIAGGQPYTPYEMNASRANYLLLGQGVLDYTAVNSQRLNIFQQLDLRLDKIINFKRTTLNLYIDIQNVFLFKTPAMASYTFKRKADNSGFETTDGLPVKPDGSNAIPVLLDNNEAIFLPTIGFIFEF